LDLKTKLLEANIILDDKFYQDIDIFIKAILEWNKIHNLTGAKTKEDIIMNILDSLYPLAFLPKVKTILDIGTGAGFPGLILAMALPEIDVILAEPRRKRTAFLNYIKATCGLDRVIVQNQRVEDIQPQKIDLITSRAVTNTKKLIDLSRNFVYKKSLYLFYKGENVQNEISDLKNYQIFTQDKRQYLLFKESEL
jgi:16S rRNA (guanine527-N7)-methyltransferase